MVNVVLTKICALSCAAAVNNVHRFVKLLQTNLFLICWNFLKSYNWMKCNIILKLITYRLKYPTKKITTSKFSYTHDLMILLLHSVSCVCWVKYMVNPFRPNFKVFYGFRLFPPQFTQRYYIYLLRFECVIIIILRIQINTKITSLNASWITIISAELK